MKKNKLINWIHLFKKTNIINNFGNIWNTVIHIYIVLLFTNLKKFIVIVLLHKQLGNLSMKTRYLQCITIKQWKSHISLQCRVEINSKCLLSFGREEVYVPWGNDLKNRERFLEGVLCAHPMMKKKGIQSRNSSVSMAPPIFTAEALRKTVFVFLFFLFFVFLLCYVSIRHLLL